MTTVRFVIFTIITFGALPGVAEDRADEIAKLARMRRLSEPIAEPKELSKLDLAGKKPTSMSVSANGRIVVVGTQDGSVEVWDTVDASRLLSSKPHKLPVTDVLMSDDGSRIISGGGTKVVVWSVLNSKAESDFDLGVPVQAVRFDQKSHHLLAVGPGPIAMVWDSKNKRLVDQSKPDEDRLPVRDPPPLFLSPDGNSVITCNRTTGVSKKTLFLIRTTNSMFGEDLKFNTAAFAGPHLVILGHRGGQIHVWNTRAGSYFPFCEGHGESVTSLNVSSNGKRLVSASVDKTIRVWDSMTRKLLHQYKGHSGDILAVAHSPSGRRIFSASADGTVRIWAAPK